MSFSKLSLGTSVSQNTLCGIMRYNPSFVDVFQTPLNKIMVNQEVLLYLVHQHLWVQRLVAGNLDRYLALAGCLKKNHSGGNIHGFARGTPSSSQH